MKLSTPKKNIWWIALILAILGVVGSQTNLPLISSSAFWLVLAGYVLLFLGTLIKGF